MFEPLEYDFNRFRYVGDQNEDFWDDLRINPRLKICFLGHWIDSRKFESDQSAFGQFWIESDIFESYQCFSLTCLNRFIKMWIDSALVVNMKFVGMDVTFKCLWFDFIIISRTWVMIKLLHTSHVVFFTKLYHNFFNESWNILKINRV